MVETALIVGAGAGLSASVARRCARDGMAVALAARNPAKLSSLCAEIGATAHACDVADPAAVNALFEAVVAAHGIPDLVVFNPSQRVRGPFVEVDPAAVQAAIMTTAFGAFLVGQAAAKLMVPRGAGSIQFTGATAGIKGVPHSASFAMGKFALRGLAQSMARELAPQGLHIAHFVIDGGIATAGGTGSADDRMLDPDAIAETYLAVHRQHRSAWSWEMELRPWVEKW